jgi:hypothetical protein
VGSKFQMPGFYLAGVFCLVLAVLKLTIEGQWSWWGVLLPLRVVLDHNALYIVVRFVWFSLADDGASDEEATIGEGNSSYTYQVAALMCFLFFADTPRGWAEIGLVGTDSGVGCPHSVVCQLLFWSTVVPESSFRTWRE